MSGCRLVDGRAYLVDGFNVSAFYEVLAEVVASRKTAWRSLARDTGVGQAALKRMAQGRCPNATALARLSAWANLNPADFVVAQNDSQPRLLAAISTLLESDPNLDPAAARDLQTIIYLAYAGFTQAHQ
jgi:hypothetical protein